MPSTDTRQFLRDLLRLLGLPVLLLIGAFLYWRPWALRRYQPPAPTTVFDVAIGVWDQAGTDSFCLKNPHRIAFLPTRDTMYLYHAETQVDSVGRRDSITVYQILGHSPSHLRTDIVSKQNLNPTNQQ